MLRRAIAEGAWPDEPAQYGGEGTSHGRSGSSSSPTPALDAPVQQGNNCNWSRSLEGRAFTMLRLLAQPPPPMSGVPHRLPLAVSVAEELCEAAKATGTTSAPRVSCALKRLSIYVKYCERLQRLTFLDQICSFILKAVRKNLYRAQHARLCFNTF
jgi:hypothetical protein